MESTQLFFERALSKPLPVHKQTSKKRKVRLFSTFLGNPILVTPALLRTYTSNFIDVSCTHKTNNGNTQQLFFPR